MGRKWGATTLILMTLAVAALGIKDFTKVTEHKWH